MNSLAAKSEVPHRSRSMARFGPAVPRGRNHRGSALLALATLITASLGALAADPTPAPPAAAAPAKPSGAKIVFATPNYDFGRLTANEGVTHTFYFTNVGTTTLELASVTPSCGCTTAGEWSRSVEPGKFGSIPIRFNTPNYSGPVAKSVTVKCNDPAQETVVLQFKGTVWQPIDVTPRYAMLNATTESPNASVSVRITNNLEQAVTVSAPESNSKSFAAELKTIKEGREYEVTVKTVPPLAAGNVSGIITLKTSATNMPNLSITAFANVAAVVTVVPPSISLPPAPLTAAVPFTVTIRNTSTNALTLSKPTTNAKGVEVQLKEVEPGRNFTVTLNFPVGYEVPQGENIELSLESNNPQFPTLKVPIHQQARAVSQPPVPVTGQVVKPAGPAVPH